ncbi:hypothetical protein [Rhodopirellula baltica]
MFQKYVDPALPPFPALHFDAEESQAYVSMRVANWESVERANIGCRLCMIAYAIFIFLAAAVLVPATDPPLLGWVIAMVVSSVVAMVGSGILRKALPGPLSRFVFARRVSIFVASDVVGFRSWFYDNGVRMNRQYVGGVFSIQPNVAKDSDAIEFIAAEPPPGPHDDHKSNHHLDDSMQLQLVIRGSSEEYDAQHMDDYRRFRTIPVASMPASVAQNFASVLSTALNMTSRTVPNPSRQAVGLDLDLAYPQQGGAA